MKKKIFLLTLGCLFTTAAFAQQDMDELPNPDTTTSPNATPRRITPVTSSFAQQDTEDVNISELMKNIDTISHWKGTGTLSLNASQVSLSNWAAGGEASVSGNAGFIYSLIYEQNRILWRNRLELAYGLSNTESNGVRKTTDKIYLNSLYGYKVADKWYASMFLNFQSQFAKGYNYQKSRTQHISRFMAPGYLSIGPGITWIPNSWFIATFSPATWRGTFVTDKTLSNQGAYGVKPGKHLLSEFGADLKMVANFYLMPNINVYSRLELFSNYLHKPQNIDVHWDTQVTMKINKWVSASLNLSMIYDDDVKFAWDPNDSYGFPLLQFKEVLGVGFMATF